MQRHRVILATLALGICLWAGYRIGGKGAVEETSPQTVRAASPGMKARPAPAAQRAEPADTPLFEVEGWHLCEPSAAPLAAEETLASRQVSATTVLKPECLPALGTMREGWTFALPVHGSAPLTVMVFSVS